MTFTRPHGWSVGVGPQGFIGKEHLLPGLLADLNPDWWYNWAPFLWVPDAHPGYIPMLWSGREALATNTEQLRATLTARPDNVWQFMNEPENNSQANMTPSAAFEGLKAFVRLAWDTGATGQYAAPGVEMSHKGLKWATEFFRLCRQHFLHRPAYVTVHCYLNGSLAQNKTNWDEMWSRFWEFHEIWTPGVPVVVSETCAVNRPEAQQRIIMDLAREMLETDSRVVGVAWFCANDGPENPFPNSSLSLYDPDTDSMRLTPLGEYWKSLR